jgi:hemoglobin
MQLANPLSRPSRTVVAATLLTVLMATSVAGRGKTLFESMGGESVLHAAMDQFADFIIADDRINFTFAEADLAKFKQLLYEQLCELSGGPCHYTGRDMETAHAKLHLNNAQFNALAEDLYRALGKAGVPYRQQNRLMALLAPMQRDIVKPGHAEPNAAIDDKSDPE